MAYFPNGTAGMCYVEQYCCKCIHWPQKDEDPGCAVDLIHNLYNYDQCKDTPEGKAIEAILDMLIPRTKDDLGNERCSMFHHRLGISDKHLKDWEKYKAVMAEAAAMQKVGA